MTVVLVHGGAGAWERIPGRLEQAVAVCAKAAAAGRAALADGGPALHAVEAAVRVLEDSPLMNAGRGSYPNRDGIVELDAMIMDGRTLDFGAVAAVQRVLHPISLARIVMTQTPHSLLVAVGAEAFADSIQFPRCENGDLLVQREHPAGDTVGAVALDADGNVAAATSTGGIPNKMPGRVGDSPLAGSGAYADNERGAVSATGDGEALMKLVISKVVADMVGAGAEPQAACEQALGDLVRRLPRASGGLIALDRAGRIGVACNTQAMPYAYARDTAAAVASYARRA